MDTCSNIFLAFFFLVSRGVEEGRVFVHDLAELVLVVLVMLSEPFGGCSGMLVYMKSW